MYETSTIISRSQTDQMITLLLQVDAHLSHDAEASYQKALRLADLYAKKGIDPK